ncbi:Feruloyl coa ortho-hydroxylase [Thalictrum thalictroides]|uniref:Feruloyl coa ortho-hydroxylase n=1 Tax=Thalictrum thalictroides TaxID=46969 RepID=A0A7J6WTT3_THATH|nr:Feruloyl coa ortho-hydroxylase [Thalictrum thalictroides]
MNYISADVTPLPVIDLSRLDGPEHDQDQVKEALVKAAETVGFFYVVKHGLSTQLLEEVKDAARQFFNQPAEKKLAYLKGVSPSSLVNYGTSFVPEKKKSFEWKDYCSMYYNDNDNDALKYWPDQCSEIVLKYMKMSTTMARRIMEILMKNLGEKLDDSMAETYMGVKVVNMNFYPTCPDPGLTVGVGRHSDFGTLTVLLQDDIGGLSIRVQAEGDIGKEDTKQWKIPKCRVRTTSTQSRVSIPVFLNPGPMVNIGPLPQVVEKDGKAEYKTCLFKDYKNQFFAQTYHGKKALEFLKITTP